MSISPAGEGAWKKALCELDDARRRIADLEELLRVACELAEAAEYHRRSDCLPAIPCGGTHCRLQEALAAFHALVDPESVLVATARSQSKP